MFPEAEHRPARVGQGAGRLAVAGRVAVLHDRIGEVPPGVVWVHCVGGLRSAITASLLDASGRSVVAVDDGIDAAGRAGLTVTRAGGATA